MCFLVVIDNLATSLTKAILTKIAKGYEYFQHFVIQLVHLTRRYWDVGHCVFELPQAHWLRCLLPRWWWYLRQYTLHYKQKKPLICMVSESNLGLSAYASQWSLLTIRALQCKFLYKFYKLFFFFKLLVFTILYVDT